MYYSIMEANLMSESTYAEEHFIALSCSFVFIVNIIYFIIQKKEDYKKAFNNLKIPVDLPLLSLRENENLPLSATKIPKFWWDNDRKRYYSQCCHEGPIVSINRVPVFQGVCNCTNCTNVNKMDNNTCILFGGYFLGIDGVEIKGGDRLDFVKTWNPKTLATMKRGSCKSCKTCICTYGGGTFTGIIFIDGFPFVPKTHFFADRKFINDERNVDHKTLGLSGFVMNLLRVTVVETCLLGMCTRRKLRHSDFDETQVRYCPNEQRSFQIQKRSNIYFNKDSKYLKEL